MLRGDTCRSAHPMRLFLPLRNVLHVFFLVLFMMSPTIALPEVHKVLAARDTDGNPSSDQSQRLSPVAAVGIAVAVFGLGALATAMCRLWRDDSLRQPEGGDVSLSTLTVGLPLDPDAEAADQAYRTPALSATALTGDRETPTMASSFHSTSTNMFSSDAHFHGGEGQESAAIAKVRRSLEDSPGERDITDQV